MAVKPCLKLESQMTQNKVAKQFFSRKHNKKALRIIFAIAIGKSESIGKITLYEYFGAS